MRYLILSDIHANWEALEAVLSHAEGRYEKILNCGDVVGYGPDPNRVVEWCREHTPVVVRGNHDKACAGLADLTWFNPAAQASALWTSAELSPENSAWIHDLPQGPLGVDDFQILHGSPEDEDEYLVSPDDVYYAASFLSRSVSFFGHTHLQGGFYIHRNGIRRLEGDSIFTEETAAYLFNPGSVGQPRDRDPRAAYAIYTHHDRRVDYYRAAYDIPTTQSKIRRAGLPDALASRLSVGL